MDLKQMRYFLVLAQERNFSRAAERLHMAQPPLTRSIQGLEDHLGVQLFVRTPRGAELTEAGKSLLDGVPNVLDMIRRMEEQTRLAASGVIGRIDVGIFSSGVLDVIPRLLGTFHARWPQVKIGLHSLTKAEQIAALREQRIQVGFNRLVPEEDDIAVEPVRRERFIVALYDGHPLCAHDAITIDMLDDEPMILYPNVPLHGLAQETAAAFRDEGVRLRVEQEVEDVVTAVALVASRFGLCITTESAANLRLPGVRYRPLRSTRLRDVELSCLYRRDDASPTLQRFLDCVRASAATQTAQACDDNACSMQ